MRYEALVSQYEVAKVERDRLAAEMQATVEGCDSVFIRLPAHGISFTTIGYGVLQEYHTIGN